MSDIPAIRRQLKIKAGVVKRLGKECNLYKKEAGDQRRKLDKFIADGAEDWDINNGTRMMEESDKMITDSANRLGKAVGELRDLIVEAKKELGLAGDQELLEAEKVLQEAGV
ncbi:tubulin binding cofactor A-domain-containing protein [Collybia nuda]|uniref:Tubulin-specific chaperone A n=1 Tax=Collybia nuda TaxID=64659 RepID=A0A9P5YKY2_9AGAR|nr:tubulin binding cofactor A-domain-containing protein [Collybia nuda]